MHYLITKHGGIMGTEIKPTKRSCPLQHADGSPGKIVRERHFISTVDSLHIVIGGKNPGYHKDVFYCDTCRAFFNYERNDEEKAEDEEKGKNRISIDDDDGCL